MDLWISAIIARIVVWILPVEHSETQTPESFIKFTKWSQKTSMVILIIFVPWTLLQRNTGEHISSTREEIYEQLVKLDNWLSFYGIFKIFPGFAQSRYPSQGTQAMLTQEAKKVWNLQPKSSHTRGAECKEQLEEQHRQGAGVQPYPVIT